MAESTAFRVHQVCSISPPQETSPISLTLTFYDILWLRLPPVERLFFYPFPNSTTLSFYDTILPNLKRSLSLTLQHFLLLAGTITWPLHSHYPLITYTPGHTVPLTITESTADFNRLCSNLCEAEESQHLIPHLTISHDQASLLALQVTLFPNFGFCIGITTHHGALDGKSSTLFMKAWAHLCSHLGESQSLPQHLTPSFDRSIIRDPSGIGEAYLNYYLNFGGATNNRRLNKSEFIHTPPSDLVKGVFELTPIHIQKLKKHAESKANNKGLIRLSSFSVTCAYLLACAVKVDKPKTERVAFVFPVDCRSRLDPPIPETYFGNCVLPRLLVAKTEDILGNNGFVKGVEGISDLLCGLESGVLNGAENWIQKRQSVKGDRVFAIAGSPRFECYGIDFGWGRPKKMDMTSFYLTGTFSLTESKDNKGGIEIGLALSKGKMEAFATIFSQGLECL